MLGTLGAIWTPGWEVPAGNSLGIGGCSWQPVRFQLTKIKLRLLCLIYAFVLLSVCGSSTEIFTSSNISTQPEGWNSSALGVWGREENTSSYLVVFFSLAGGHFYVPKSLCSLPKIIPTIGAQNVVIVTVFFLSKKEQWIKYWNNKNNYNTIIK